MNRTYSIAAVLAAFKAANTICPMVFNAIGSMPCHIDIYIHYLLGVIFGEHAGSLPVGFRALESAQATKDLRVSLPGTSPRPAPPGLITTYRDHSIAELRAQAERTKSTRLLADKYRRLPAIEQLGNGCCQQPGYGAGIYAANFQAVYESYAPVLLRTRDAECITASRDAGYRVLQTPTIPIIRFLNAAGSTGNGAEVQDAMLAKRIAAELGLSVKNHLFLFLPSCSTSVNPNAARANTGKLLLEVMLAMEHPEKIKLNTLDGQELRYTGGAIYDDVTPVGITSEFLAAGNRSELAARMALLALAYVCTPLLSLADEQFADSKAQTDRRHGLALLSRIGFNRCFVENQRNAEIFKTAMIAEVSRKL